MGNVPDTHVDPRPKMFAALLAFMVAPAIAAGQAVSDYPPPREGIAPAVATLNVDPEMLRAGAAIFAKQSRESELADDVNARSL